MMSTLATSFKALVFYKSLMPKMITPIYASHIRDIHLGQPVHRQSIQEKLGLPEKPKRPPPAFFLFITEKQPTVIAKNPNLKQSKVISMISNLWKSLDDSEKQVYLQKSKAQLLEYAEKISEYNRNLTDEDKTKIQKAKSAINERKAVLLHKTRCRNLGRPKRPISSFSRYYQEQRDRLPGEVVKDHIKRVALRWNALSEVEKEKYETPDAGYKYQKAMSAWESKMKKLGHEDVIRTTKTIKDEANRNNKSSSAKELGCPYQEIFHQSTSISQQYNNVTNSTIESKQLEIIAKNIEDENESNPKDLTDRDTGDLDDSIKKTNSPLIQPNTSGILLNLIDKKPQELFLIGIFQPDWPEFFDELFEYEL